MVVIVSLLGGKRLFRLFETRLRHFHQATIDSDGKVIDDGKWGDCQDDLTKNSTCLNILTSRRKNDNTRSGFNCFLGGGDRKCWSTNHSFQYCPIALVLLRRLVVMVLCTLLER